MRGYKEPGFQDRVAAASSARDKALEKLRSKAPVDEAEQARRAAALAAKEVAAREKREAARVAREEALVAKKEKTAAAAAAALAAQPKVRTEEELKAARDARYAARKARTR